MFRFMFKGHTHIHTQTHAHTYTHSYLHTHPNKTIRKRKKDNLLIPRGRATRDLPGITSHHPRSPQQPGRYTGILERAWMPGVASNSGKFHVQQAKRLRAETAQREEEEEEEEYPVVFTLGIRQLPWEQIRSILF
ncbi:jg11457 [Pararge aegeria aegeria]|uniref:Jg11457 protein n=1 Tax=Pararge aegeria aegeria TaxID=348720 RepID=A0A8S4RWG4_9NEOP|nr:jg11457 [Pararge aegeria aegeria]